MAIEKAPPTRCISAHIPLDLFDALDELCAVHPGMSKTQMIKAVVAAGVKNPTAVREELGRY